MDKELFLSLIAKKLSGLATEDDLRLLQEVLSKDSSLLEEYNLFKSFIEEKENIGRDMPMVFQKIKQRINDLENSSSVQSASPVVSLKSWRQTHGTFLKVSGIAASLFLLVGISYFFINRKPSSDSKTRIEKNEWLAAQTPRGKQTTVVLPDSSKVILNADSKLQFPKTFNGGLREVYLTGEAYFNVTHDARKPFIIHTGKLNIKVLGTEFNVKSYPDDSIAEATLIRGMIEVTINGRPSDKIILKPSEKLVVSNENSTKKISTTTINSEPVEARFVIGKLHFISPTDSAIVETSWTENKLAFQNESFDELAASLERRYNVNIQFLNNSVKSYRFTGAFENENIGEVLEALKLTEKFNYKIEGNNISIY